MIPSGNSSPWPPLKLFKIYLGRKEGSGRMEGTERNDTKQNGTEENEGWKVGRRKEYGRWEKGDGRREGRDREGTG